MRSLIYALAGGAALAVVAVGGWLLLTPPDAPRSPAALAIGDTSFGGAFELTAHTGDRITDREVIDGPTLIYFGYTYCPDVCPIDAQVMAEAVEMLDQKGHDVTPVFVTVDPERDTPEELAGYAEAMHPKMLGLTGSEAEIKAVAELYKVYYDRVEMPDSAIDYLMNHTAYTYFMRPDGVAAVFRNGFPPEEMAGEVARILADG
ncbi:MAG: SCO family protein [Pseudomonadota bacterium]